MTKNIHYGKSVAPTSVVSKTRRCSECKRTFINPESYRVHKRRDGYCRNEEALVVVGFVETPDGWAMRWKEKKP